MRQYPLLLLILLLSCTGFAQRGIFVNGSAAGLSLMPEGTISVDGDFQMLKGDPSPLKKSIFGQLYISGNLVVDDTLYFDMKNDSVPPATLHFVGSGDAHITGAAPLYIFQTTFAKVSGNVYIDRDVTVFDTITFLSGNAIIAPQQYVTLDFRQGTNTVPSNPWITGENAQHRFTGDGFLKMNYILEAGHGINIANTGFHFNDHQSDTLQLVRGHVKQLYAGNGGIDRYFDVNMIGANKNLLDTLGISYLHDVDYAAMSVDTAKLGVYISGQFADMDFRNASHERNFRGIDYAVTDTAAFSRPTVAVAARHFRMTLGDTNCNQPPVSSLPQAELHLCADDSLLVTAENTVAYGFPNSVQYYWLQDGQTVPARYAYPMATAQELIVKLTDSRGCYSFDTLRIAPTARDPEVAFSWVNACFGDSVLFTNQTTIIDTLNSFVSTWNFGNGTSASPAANPFQVLYGAPGTYTVSLTAVSNYGCTASIANEVNVFNLPVADIQTSINCFNETFFIDGTGSAGTTIPTNYGLVSYHWDIDSGTETHTTPSFYTASLAPGTHLLQLEVISGVSCRDTLTRLLTVDVPDTAGFTVSTACAGSPIALVNTSFIANPDAQYHWSFSDGTTSEEETPLKSFATPGIKVIQLVVETAAACADTFSTSITVNPNPDASFTYTGSCLGTTHAFQASTLSGANTYTWNFSDGTVMTGALVQHAFAGAGTYSATLTVQNGSNCSAQTTSQVTVHPLPVAAYSFSTACQGTATQFTSTSSGSGLTSSWNFGDFSPAGSGNSLQHVYANSGTYHPTLTVTSAAGCSATLTQAVQVRQLPVVNLGALSTCGASYVLDAANPGATYLWSPSNATSQQITVYNSGIYAVSVTDGFGCQRTGQANVTLNSVVQPDLGADGPICGERSLNAGYAGADFVWQDGSTAGTFQVTTPGTYWVAVTDQNGCTGSDTVVIPAVYPFFQPQLGPDLNICTTEFPVVLTAGTYDSYLWSTGSTGNSLQLSGNETVWLEVHDAQGCIGRDTVEVHALESPASTLAESVSTCDEAVLVATSDPGNSFLWNTGAETASIPVTVSGTYSVILTDIASGCQLWDTVEVTIQASPVVNLGPDISVCSASPVTLDANQAGAAYAWTSSSNVLLSTASTYVPVSSGTYLVTVSNGSCSVSDAVTITILPSPVIPVQVPNFYICGTTPVNLKGCAFAANNWSGSNGFSSQAIDVSTYETGIYSVVSNVGSCTTTRTFLLETSPSQLEAFYLVDSDTTKNLALKFIDLSSPQPTSYLWDFGDGSFDTTASPVHQYSMVNVYVTSLTVSNGICISRFEKAINQKHFYDYEPTAPVSRLELLDGRLYPNPATDVIHLEAYLNDKADCEVILYDITGHILYRQKLDPSKEIELDIPVQALETGAYFVRFNAESLKGNVVRNYKIIKSH